MTDERLPYMPVYVDEFDTSQTVKRLTYEGEGIYNALMRHQWRDGYLPATEAAIRELLELEPDEYPELWALVEQKFPCRKGRRMNAKLAALRRHAIGKVKTARRLAMMRWHSQGTAKADANADAIKGSKGNEVKGSKEKPWVLRLAAIWVRVYKPANDEAPIPMIGKLLLPVKDDPELESRFTAYVNQTPARFVNLKRFVETYGTWSGNGKAPQSYTHTPGVAGPEL